jgi:hypothetical protein
VEDAHASGTRGNRHGGDPLELGPGSANSAREQRCGCLAHRHQYRASTGQIENVELDRAAVAVRRR